jgi:hypothetical protein
MLNQNCMHLLHNSVAMIRRQRPAPFGQGDVDALLFTSVSPGCSSVLINAEMGDTATVQRTDCKCIFGQAGLGWEIRDVASYSKLTGQGMTLMGNDIIAILEHDLPRKFGGAPADYQLVERQRGNQTEIELRVSPRVGMSNPDNVRRELVKSLRSIYGGSLATRVWEHSGALRVVEEEPFATSSGKVPLLHLANTRAQDGDIHEP